MSARTLTHQPNLHIVHTENTHIRFAREMMRIYINRREMDPEESDRLVEEKVIS